LGAAWLIPRLAARANEDRSKRSRPVFVGGSRRTSSSEAISLMARDLAKYRGLATTGCWRTSDNARFVSFFHYIRQYMSYKIERCWCRSGMEIPIATARLTAD